MQRLTQDMIFARSKQTDLNSIKKFNCWGNELCDVSIVKDLHVVEVLALSVNKINTLKPFEKCTQLQELYLRKNNIQDLNEIEHLKRLPHLKKLWLEDNPCCNRAGASYRAYVLRALPNLKILDNIEVTQEEVDEALRGAGCGAEANIAKRYNNDDVNEQQQQKHEQSQSTSQQQQQQYHEQRQPLTQQQQRQSYEQRQHTLMQQKQQLYEQRQPQFSHHPPQPEYRERLCETYHKTPRDGGDGKANVRELHERAPTPPVASTMSMKDFFQSDRSSHQQHKRLNPSKLSVGDEHQQPHNNNHKPYGRISAVPNSAEPGNRLAYRNGRENATNWLDEPYQPSRPSQCYNGDNLRSISTTVSNHSNQQQQHNNYNPYGRHNSFPEISETVECYAYKNGRENATPRENELSRRRQSVGCYNENARSVSKTVLSDSHQQQHKHNHNTYDRLSCIPEMPEPVDSYTYINGRENGTDRKNKQTQPRRSEEVDCDNLKSLSKTLISHCSGCLCKARNKNSSLLSVVLWLVNELDYASLQVVEHAIRNHIHELPTE